MGTSSDKYVWIVLLCERTSKVQELTTSL